MLTGRRAVSEVIASLVLLLIVSVLGTFLYSYSLSATGFRQNVLQGDVLMKAERAQERFRVIAVWWSGSGDLLNLTILNYGRLDIEIADIYVNGEKVTDHISGQGEEIYTSSLRQASFTSPVPISTGVLYEIVIVSERGVSHVYSWKL